MPFPNFHAARLRDPDAFARIVVLKTLPNGVMLLGGPLKSDPGGKVKTQTVRFPRAHFSVEQARAWLADHGLKPIEFEEATGKDKQTQGLQAFVSVQTFGMQALTGVDIMSMVPSSTIDRLKERDPHPFLQAYSICHEGDSQPTVLGEAVARVIRWTRAAVQSIRRISLKGVKFFLGHNEDNSTKNREPLGEVVWDGQREIDGRLHHVVVGYFPDREAVRGLDICSQEAEWNFFEGARRWIADTVKRITAIALSSSSVDEPAFPHARRLAYVQATSVVLDKVDQLAQNTRRRKMSDVDLTTIPFGELQGELKRRGTFPSQLFTVEDLQKDRAFVPIFEQATTDKKSIEAKDKELKELKEKHATAEKVAQASTARARFDKMLETMKLTPRLKAYLQNSFPKEVADASDEALKRIVDSGTEAYQVAVKTFGVKDEAPPAQRTDGQKSEADDMSKAENNPLLEEDVSLST